jgi:hypothetical protein
MGYERAPLSHRGLPMFVSTFSKSFRPVAIASALVFGAPALASTGGLEPLAAQLNMGGDCGCSGKADCTCKKGACKCAKCGKANKSRVIDAMKANPDPSKLPETARWDATAGVLL